jgi:hypothetical protein
MTGDYSISLELGLSEELKARGLRDYGFTSGYSLTVDGTAEGTLNKETRTFHLVGNQATWREHVFPEGTSAATRAEAYRMFGAPTKHGEITGKVDWENFGGGEGRFKINELMQGVWKVEPLSPYRVTPPADAARYGRLPVVRVYPNEALAIKHIQRDNVVGGWVGKPKEIPELGDQVFIAPTGKMMLIRTGRWHIDYTHFSHRFGSPETFRDSVKRIRQFIEDTQLDTKLPVLPER